MTGVQTCALPIFRPEPDGLGEIPQCAVQVAFGAAHIALVVEGVGIVRLEPDGLGVILQRAVQVAFVAACIAPVEEGVGIVRLEPDGLARTIAGQSTLSFGPSELPRPQPSVLWRLVVRREIAGAVPQSAAHSGIFDASVPWPRQNTLAECLARCSP